MSSTQNASETSDLNSFLDLPAELRNDMYDLIIDGSVLVHLKRTTQAKKEAGGTISYAAR